MEIKQIAQQFYDYSLHIKGYSKDTIRRYKFVLEFYCKTIGIKTINEANQENVRQLLFYGRTERKWSSNTAVVFHKSLLVFFRWCMDRGYLKNNPIEGIEKPFIEQKIPVKLNKQDALRLLEIVENYPYNHSFLRFRNHALFSMFIFAGLRRNELLNLKYTDVDLQNMTIFVRQGKGRKDRIVPITYTLTNILRRYLEVRNKRHTICPEFFTSLQYNQRLTVNGLKHIVGMAIKASGMKFSVHKLRHTFATLMIEGGCDIYSLSKMMGHSDIKTTTIYLSATAEHLRGQIMKHPLNNF